MPETIDEVFRDYNTAGVPGSGDYKPEKPKMRRLFKEMAGGLLGVGEFRSAWLVGSDYVKGDIVEYGGSAWYSLRDNSGVIPTEGADWSLFASGGSVADGAITPPKLDPTKIADFQSLLGIVSTGAITPELYGALGDGTADDGVAFRAAAIAAMAAKSTLQLKAGASYKLTTWTPITTTAGNRLKIQGNGATVTGPGGTTYFVWADVGGFEVDGVRFTSGWYGLFQRWNYKWGASDPLFPGVSTNIGAQTDVLSDCKFTNNVVSGCTGYVFNIGIRINELTIEGNLFEGNSGGYAIRLGEKVTGEFNVSWRGVRIKRNRFFSMTGPAGISVSPVLLYVGQGEITDNRVDGVTSTGLGEAWGMYFQGADLVVSGNHVQNVTTSGGGGNTDITGISMKGAQDDSGGFVEQSGMSGKVFGNICRNIGAGTAWGTGFKLQQRRCQVFGNEAQGCTYAGFAMDNLLGSQDQSVNDNVSISCNYGIIITGNGSRYQVKNNSIYVCTIGIYFAPGSYGAFTSASIATIEGNLISNNASGSIGLQFYFGVTTSALDIISNIVACDIALKWVAGSPGTATLVRYLDNQVALSTSASTGTAPAGLITRTPT